MMNTTLGRVSFFGLHFEVRSSSRRRIRVAIFLLALGLTLSVMTIALMMLAKSGNQPSDPFLAYADLVQIGSSLSTNVFHERGFTCNKIFMLPGDLHCSLRPAEGAFHEIAVKLTQGAIQQVTFAVNDGALTVGTLSSLWGKPDIHITNHEAFLYWNDLTVRAVAKIDNRHFSYWLPVIYVIFE